MLRPIRVFRTVAGEHSSPSLTLLADDGVTYIHSGDRPGLLYEILGELSKKNPETTGRKPLQALKAFSAKDGSIVMDIFDFGKRQKFTGDTEEEELGKSRILEYINDLKSGKFAGEAGHASPDSELFEQAALDEHGNFDIIFDLFSRICQLQPHPTRAVCYLVPMLIGC